MQVDIMTKHVTTIPSNNPHVKKNIDSVDCKTTFSSSNFCKNLSVFYVIVEVFWLIIVNSIPPVH